MDGQRLWKWTRVQRSPALAKRHSFVWSCEQPELIAVRIGLQTRSAEALELLGKAFVKAELQDRAARLPLLDARSTGVSLLGQSRFRGLGISVARIRYLHLPLLDGLLKEYTTVFEEPMDGNIGLPFHIHVLSDSKVLQVPASSFRVVRCCFLGAGPTRSGTNDRASTVSAVAYAHRRCTSKEWTTADTRVKTGAYPLQSTSELLATLRGGKIFSKIDLAHA